jgi:hypothetical protein
MNSQLFLEWVKEDLCPVLKKGQVIILDNATFHKNKKLHIHLSNEGLQFI